MLLMGDSLGDPNMSRGIGAREILKLGFLNDKVGEADVGCRFFFFYVTLVRRSQVGEAPNRTKRVTAVSPAKESVHLFPYTKDGTKYLPFSVVHLVLFFSPCKLPGVRFGDAAFAWRLVCRSWHIKVAQRRQEAHSSSCRRAVLVEETIWILCLSPNSVECFPRWRSRRVIQVGIT